MGWNPFRRSAAVEAVRGRIAPTFRLPHHGQPAARAFNAATMDLLTSDMPALLQSGNAALRPSLRVMRARSRHLAENNDYMRSFLRTLDNKVLGIDGIRLIVRAMRPDGVTVDTADSDFLEARFAEWAKKGNCTVCGRYAFRDVQRLVLTSEARDGELLVRMVRPFANEWGFALQLFEGDVLDENLNVARGSGATNGIAILLDHEVRMGVERNAWGRVVAYWILTRHPGDDLGFWTTANHYTRVPAAEVLHIFIPDRIDDARGAPWAWTAIRRLQMTGGYEEAELVAARLGASKGGFFEEDTDGDTPGDGTTGDGETIQEVQPGTFERLPPGVKFKAYDPQHPNANFGSFLKAVLRGAAAGLGVSYNGLARDLEGVNFGSLRQGELDERDMWRALQGHLIRELCEPVFSAWLDMALLKGALGTMPPSKRDKFDADVWKGRGWPWIDPQKDITAGAQAVDLGVLSLTQIAAERGVDIEDVFRERKRELDLAKQYGVPLGTGAPKLAAGGAGGPAEAGATDGNADPQNPGGNKQ